MGVQVYTPGFKPLPWDVDLDEMGSEWGWFWDRALFVAPLWSGEAEIVDLVRNKSATCPIDWRVTSLGEGLRTENNLAVARFDDGILGQVKRDGFTSVYVFKVLATANNNIEHFSFGQYQTDEGGSYDWGWYFAEPGNRLVYYYKSGASLEDSFVGGGTYVAIGSQRASDGDANIWTRRIDNDTFVRVNDAGTSGLEDDTANIRFGGKWSGNRTPDVVNVAGYVLDGWIDEVDALKILVQPFGPIRPVLPYAWKAGEAVGQVNAPRMRHYLQKMRNY